VGVSALVDDRGRVVERTPTHVEASLVVTAETRDVGSPYRLWGDLPLWGVVALVAAWLAAGAWRRRRPVAGQ
jgi:apolipoprotein N-acyltransferase